MQHHSHLHPAAAAHAQGSHYALCCYSYLLLLLLQLLGHQHCGHCQQEICSCFLQETYQLRPLLSQQVTWIVICPPSQLQQETPPQQDLRQPQQLQVADHELLLLQLTCCGFYYFCPHDQQQQHPG